MNQLQEIQDYRTALGKGQHNLVTEYKLKAMARSLAKSLENSEIGQYLQQKISEQFDGDYDVRWQNVKDHQIKGKGRIRKLLGSHLPRMIGSMSEVEMVPNLQIALPVGMESWDGTTPIKVAYIPQTIDDTEWEYIYAYDSKGNEYQLDAQIPPDFPVLVVGINERTDINGKVVLGNFQPKGLGRLLADPGGDDDTFGGGGETDPPAPSYPSHYNGDWELLDQVTIEDNYEPWWKGAPEIVIVIAGTGTTELKCEGSLGEVDEINHPYDLGLQMFHWWQDTWERVIGVALFEADFGTYTISGKISNEYVSIEPEATLADNWDKYGQTMVDFREPPGKYDLGTDANVKLTYQHSY